MLHFSRSICPNVVSVRKARSPRLVSSLICVPPNSSRTSSERKTLPYWATDRYSAMAGDSLTVVSLSPGTAIARSSSVCHSIGPRLLSATSSALSPPKSRYCWRVKLPTLVSERSPKRRILAGESPAFQLRDGPSSDSNSGGMSMLPASVKAGRSFRVSCDQSGVGAPL